MSSPAPASRVATIAANTPSPAQRHWLVEAAEKVPDDDLVALLKAHALVVKPASTVAKLNGESSTRPAPGVPTVVDDGTLTDALLQAICAGKPLAARFLARRKGVRLQKKYGSRQRNVLHAAAAAPDSMAEVIRELLCLPEAARHINQPDRAGRTALHVAATRAAHESVLDDLLAAGANIDALDEQYLTPLQSFIIESPQTGGADRKTASHLLKSGAEVNTKNILGDSPLHNAARIGKEPLLRLLLRHGADPDSLNADGKTPQDLLPDEPGGIPSAAMRIFLQPRNKWKPRHAVKVPTKEPLCTGERRRVCESFSVTVRFYYRPRSLTWSQTASVYDVIYDKSTIPKYEKQFMDIIRNDNARIKHHFERKLSSSGSRPATAHPKPDESRGASFEVRKEDIWKWIHLPANNMNWIKDLICRLTFSPDNKTRLKQALQFVERNIKERKGFNNICSRLPHFEQECRDDNTGAMNDDDDAEDNTIANPSTSFETPPNSGLWINQHSSGPGHFSPISALPVSPIETPNTPKGRKTPKEARPRFKRSGEAWRSQTAPLKSRRLSLAIPFLDFETEIYLERRTGFGLSQSLDGIIGLDGMKRQSERMTALERHCPPFSGSLGLHLPQTLDQSYYDMLDDNELQARNRDQVVYKWFGDADGGWPSKAEMDPEDAEDEDEEYLARMNAAEDNQDAPQSTLGNRTDIGSGYDTYDDGDTDSIPASAEHGHGIRNSRDEQFGDDASESGNVVISPKDMKEHHKVAKTQRKLLIVHQLWLWKLDESTVITSLPKRWHASIEDTLIETIRQSGINDFQEPEDLIEHILLETVHFLEEYQYAGMGRHVLDIFESSIATRSSQEVECFKNFISHMKSDARNAPETSAAAVRGRGRPAKNHNIDERKNITEEITLIYEVKDIRDELHLLDRVFKDQATTVERFAQLFWPGVERYQEKSRQQFVHDCGIQKLSQRIAKLDADAARTLQDLDYLVQVKQAQSSLDEAAASGELSKQSFKQGKRAQKLNDYILLFTTVTVVFTPLSFMTSLFAIPIEGFPQDPENGNVSYEAGWFVCRIATGEVVSLVLVALALSFYRFPGLLRSFQGWTRIYSLARRRDSVASHTGDRPSLSVRNGRRFSVDLLADGRRRSQTPTPLGSAANLTTMYPPKQPTPWDRFRRRGGRVDIEEQAEGKIDLQLWRKGISGWG